MPRNPALSACAFAAALVFMPAHAQTATASNTSTATPSSAAAPAAGQGAAAGSTPNATTGQAVVITGKRAQRSSKGATGLALTIKDTPQSVSTVDKDDLSDFGLDGTNDALSLVTGVNVEQYETNRATYNARGFDIQSTQLDGLGMTNSWGTVVGQQDTFLFERIEVIRGANGLLTGVGNSSGTINYVRKRPTNTNQGTLGLTGGSYNQKRLTLDLNRRLSDDGRWAGRLVVAHDDKDSYLRALHDKRSSLYGVIDGQIGSNGTLTLGFSHQDMQQKSPMWGSLTLNYTDGRRADFDRSASTSQDWTFWNTRTNNGFIEYTHSLSEHWEFKATYNLRRTEEATRLLYAYTNGGGLNADNTGLIGWAYSAYSPSDSEILDVNVNGRFSLFGRKHQLLAGLSHATDEFTTDIQPVVAGNFLALPAFPYAGNAYAEPTWGAAESSTSGKQVLTRLYLASRLNLADGLHAIAGLNGVRLQREGSSRYGSSPATVYPDTRKLSPYLGLSYEFTPDISAYASYSDIFQNQEQVNFGGEYLAPMKGVNHEIGVKAEWLDKTLLTTLAVFGAKQRGLASYAGTFPTDTDPNTTRDGTFYYAPVDAKSSGWEFEAVGRVGHGIKLAAGIARVEIEGINGYQVGTVWVPKTTAHVRAESRLPLLPGLRAGASLRWQSQVKSATGVRQDAYALVDAFAAYEFNTATSLRLNVKNLLDKTYVRGLQYGAIYGAPRNVQLSVQHKF